MLWIKRYVAFLVVISLTVLFTSGCARTPQTADAEKSDTATTSEAAAPSEMPFGKKSPSANHESLLPGEVTLPEGTAINVRMQSGVSSATSSTGRQWQREARPWSARFWKRGNRGTWKIPVI
jgi:uncharacterized lipoprotein